MNATTKIREYLRQNVLGILALYVALGGTAMALQANSVKSKHIVNGEVKRQDLGASAVTGAKVANGTLTGTDVAGDSLGGDEIDESTLSGLPSTPSGPAGGDLDGDYPDPQLAALSVGSRELQEDSVASHNVLDDSLTGTDIDEDSLAGLAASPTGAAGGDLAGTYPNPDVAALAIGSGELAGDAVNGAKVADDSLGGADINEGTLDLGLQIVSAQSVNDSNSPKSASVNCPDGKLLLAASGGVALSNGFIGANLALAQAGPVDANTAAATGTEVGDGNAFNWHTTVYAVCATLAG